MSIKIAISGAAGRMGQMIVRCLYEKAENDAVLKNLKLIAALEKKDHAKINEDIGIVSNIGYNIGVKITNDFLNSVKDADVIIDFTTPVSTLKNAELSAKMNKCLIIGTTGLSNIEQEKIKNRAKNIPILMAANMSLGVNLLINLVKEAAKAIANKGYDIEIIERHHKKKKDSPSGTALSLGKAAAEGISCMLENVAIYGRYGFSEEERPTTQIGIHAIRAGDIIGDHTVIFATEGECIELSHRATSRMTFAYGALRAAAWIYGKKAGFYTMNDVLGFN